jgi:hypothetical protein
MSDDRHHINPIAVQTLTRTILAGSPVGADLITAAASPAYGGQFAGEEGPWWHTRALVSQSPPS